MNVEELLEMMEETLEAGTIVPFSASKRMVDVDRMRDIIDEVRNNLPDEIRESKKIVNDREQIMQNARIESESIIQQAEERARVLTSEQEIVKRSAGILDVAIEPDGAMEIAKRSRGTPRIANRMLRRVRDFAQIFYGGVITRAAADDAYDRLIQPSMEREIRTEDVGEKVMDRLRKVDQVAYVRFASVYRKFKDLDTFMAELNKLLAEK